MPHELDITNGIASFVSANNIDAWHRLGQVKPGMLTAEEALEFGMLADWNVRKVPLFAEEDGKRITALDRFATVRDNPVTGLPEFLGDVGRLYQVMQNEDLAKFLNTLVDESGANFETAGALYGGRQVFVTMKLPGHILIGGVDQIDLYLAAVSSHDGSLSFTTIVTPTRIVCKNTMNLAFSNARNVFRIRHTNGSKGLVNEARRHLDLSFQYLDGLKEEAEELISKGLTQVQFEQIITAAYGADEDASAATHTRRDTQVLEMAQLFQAQTQKNVANTAWAGLNAITEWYDHYSPRRLENEDSSRALAAIFEPGFKNKALELMRAV